jgi:glycosyltransferase involved in cell wall biosynthesis
MNILVLSWRDPKHPTAGGAEQVMHEHMKGWIKAGHTVTLFSSRVKNLPSEERLDGVNIIRKGDQYVGVKIAVFLYWQKNKDRYDFVVDQFHGIPFFTPLYIDKPKLAVLQEVTKQVWFLNELPFPLNWIIGFLGYVFEPVIFLFYRTVPFMVGSESAKKDLIKMGILGKKITVVPHGVIIEKPNPFPKKEKTKTVIYLGALAKDKGVEDAIKAFAILNKKGSYNFWIVGRGALQYQKYLLSLAESLGLDKKIKYFGFVDNKQKFELLAKAHVLVNPSAREGWGLVNIEANTMGTPVVAYSSPGLVDSVKNGQSGILCNLNTPISIVNKVEKIMEEKIYRKFQTGSLLWSESFSWKTSRRNSLSLLKEITRE